MNLITDQKFLLRLPAKTRFTFVLAAIIFLGGAVGIELIEGRFDEVHGDRNLTSGVTATVQETLEMAGVIVFIWALLVYLADNYKEVRIRFERKDKSHDELPQVRIRTKFGESLDDPLAGMRSAQSSQQHRAKTDRHQRGAVGLGDRHGDIVGNEPEHAGAWRGKGADDTAVIIVSRCVRFDCAGNVKDGEAAQRAERGAEEPVKQLGITSRTGGPSQ